MRGAGMDKLDYFNLVNQKVCPVFEEIYYCWTCKKSYFPIYLDYRLRGNDNKAININQIHYPSYPRMRVSRR